MKWNSILQEETLGVALPLLAEQKITPEKFVQMVQESVLEFNLTQAQAKKLGQTENILLEVKASTTNNQEVVVAADAKLSFDLKLVAKAVITDLDDF